MKGHILDTAQYLVAARGFSAVGLNEILIAAGVPKGSFYYYFSSKEDFGKQLINNYFRKYLLEIDLFLQDQKLNGLERLRRYWDFWRDNQIHQDPEGRCLAVKLGSEVSDMSEDMRLALRSGTSAIIERLAQVIEDGNADRSIATAENPMTIANMLYQLWMGASVMAKIARDPTPFDTALTASDRLISGSV